MVNGPSLTSIRQQRVECLCGQSGAQALASEGGASELVGIDAPWGWRGWGPGSRVETEEPGCASVQPQQPEGPRRALNRGAQGHLEATRHLLHALPLPLGHLGSAGL